MEVALVGLVLLAVLFGKGWVTLRVKGASRLANISSALLFVLAALAWAAALLPPISRYQARSFFMHMVQHELLIEVGPLFLWLARPVPVLLWALPRGTRMWLGRELIGPTAAWRPKLQQLSHPRVVVPLYLAVVTLWHLPGPYDAALQVPVLHALEHASLMAAAYFYWWLVTAAPPRWHRHGRFQLPLLYVAAAYAHNELLGVGLVLLGTPVYAFYGRTHPPWGLSPLEDQALGGAVMWIPGELIYAATLMGVLFRMLEEEPPYRGVFETYPYG